MITLQISDPVVNHFDLFLHHRHAPCEVVMLSDLSGQFLDLGVRHSLRLFRLGFHTPIATGIAEDHTSEGKSAGDESNNNCLHCFPLLLM